MIFSLVLLLIMDKHLTWYENFEHGEKLFKEKQYENAITYFQDAVTEEQEPKQRAFTRAVQTIEYKPHYYLALCYQELGESSKAYRSASLALQGEVVPNQAIYLSELAPILQEHLSQLTQKNQDYESQEEGLQLKLLFFQHLSSQRFAEAAKLLEQLPPEQRAQHEAMIGRLSELTVRRQQMEDLTTRYQATLNQLIQQGKKEPAQALLDAMASLLSPQQVENFSLQIQSIPDPEESTQNSESEIREPDPEIALLIETMKQEKQHLESMIARDQKEITNLGNRIETLSKKQTDLGSMQLSPEINTSIRVDGTTLSCIGQLLAPHGLASAMIKVRGRTRSFLAIEEQGKRTITFEEHFEALDYGKGQIIMVIEDTNGLLSQAEYSFFIRRPWFLSRSIWLGLTALLALCLFWVAWYRWNRKKQAMLKHFNPYIAGVPVRERDMFFGREKLLERIEKLVQNNCLMIFGQRRIGKTSLLHQLFDRLKQTEHPKVLFFPVFIDLQGVKESDLFHLMMGEILSTYPELEDQLHFQFSHEHMGYTSRHFSKDMKALIEHLQKQNEKRIHIVLLMDEVDAINDFSEKTNQKLRGIFMKTFSDHLSSIMAGIHLKKHWESSGSPWYNFFEEIPMAHISTSAARNLISTPVKGIFNYDEAAVALIIHESGCQPFLVQKICVSLVNQQLEANDGRKRKFRITREDVELVLKKMRDERKIIEGVQSS